MAGLFRFFLALIVVNEHIERNVNFGGYAVNTFFVLSGFWVTRMWLGKYQNLRQPVLTFWASRVWRIYPAFFVMIAVAGAMRGVVPPAFAFLPFAPTAAEWIGPAWSLAPEMQFYLLAPFVIPLLKRQAPTVGLLLLLAACTFAGILFSYRGFITFAMFFALGSAVAVHDFRPSRGLVQISAVLCLAVVVVSRAVPELRAIFFSYETGAAVWGGAALALIGAPFALWTARIPSRSIPDRALGDASYTLYLAHWPVIALVWANTIGAGTAWAMSLAAGAALLAVEIPSERARRYFLDKRQRVTTSGAAEQLSTAPS